MIAEGMKRCNRCGEVKPREEFYFQDGKHRKRMSRCKACIVDVRMEAEGLIRRTPYKGGCQPPRNPLNYCAKCGQRKSWWGNNPSETLCKNCRSAMTNEEYGGKAWLKCLAAIASAPGRQRTAWENKMDTLTKSLEIRRRPHGECEKRRARKTPSNWQERMRSMAHTGKPRDQWTITMETKARNWRRKERKVTVYVKGEFTQVTAAVARTGIQMRFDWA